MAYQLVLANCLDWMRQRAKGSIHAIVTDPPFSPREFSPEEQVKLRAGRGGTWRVPPTLNGCRRRPVPRFTELKQEELWRLHQHFRTFAELAIEVLVPGGHLFVATHPLLSRYVYEPLLEVGFVKRAEIVRLVQTLRGGDRPKGAHLEFPEVTVMPRSAWEPWGLFRVPGAKRVQDNLRAWKTGGLRRVDAGHPFTDVIPSAPTRPQERALAPHPSLKPQKFMRQIVRASLPLGEGVVLDPFMGGGATIAAAEAVGYDSIGIEVDKTYFEVARAGVPRLRALIVTG